MENGIEVKFGTSHLAHQKALVNVFSSTEISFIHINGEKEIYLLLGRFMVGQCTII